MLSLHCKRALAERRTSWFSGTLGAGGGGAGGTMPVVSLLILSCFVGTVLSSTTWDPAASSAGFLLAGIACCKMCLPCSPPLEHVSGWTAANENAPSMSNTGNRKQIEPCTSL